MIQSYAFTLLNLGDHQQISLKGNFIECVEAVGTLTVVTVPGFRFTMKKGDVIRSDNFPTDGYEGFQVVSDTAGDVVKLKAGTGISFSLSNIVSLLASIAAAFVSGFSAWSDNIPNIQEHGNLNSLTGTIVSPQSGVPKAIIISNMPNSAGLLMVGDNTNTGAGTPVMPGQTMNFYSPDVNGGGFRQMALFNPNAFALTYTARWVF